MSLLEWAADTDVILMNGVCELDQGRRNSSSLFFSLRWLSAFSLLKSICDKAFSHSELNTKSSLTAANYQSDCLESQEASGTFDF